MIRIEADRRLGDFAAVPAVRFGIESPEIAFVTSGKQPFTLAVDHPDAADVYLPIGDIASANPSRIPEASIIDAAIRTLTLSTISAGSAPLGNRGPVGHPAGRNVTSGRDCLATLIQQEHESTHTGLVPNV
jgi:hypothetical protein